MKLVFIAESFPVSPRAEVTGGVETRDWYVAIGLAKRHQVTVVTAARIGEPTETSLKGVTIIRVGQPVSFSDREKPWVRIGFFRACLRLVPTLTFDLIQGSNTFTQYIAAQIAQQTGSLAVALIPDILIGSWIKNTNLITGVIGEVMEPLAIHYPWSGIISWSQATAEKLVAHRIDPSLIKVIPGGIDLATINHTNVKKFSHPTIVSAARLVKYKHLDALIKATALLTRHKPEVRLLIAGDGPEKVKLQQLIGELHLEQKVRLLGQVNNHHKVLKLMQAATVFSLPSTVEGFGLATIEACATGLPYVNVDIPATRELTQGGKGGFLIPEPDPNLIADKLNQLLSNKALYNTKVRQSLSLAKSYDWQTCINQTEKYFQTILRQTSGGRRH